LNRAIGVLGGTFDPIHLGHLRPTVEVRETLGLDHVRLIPARVSPLRGQPAASPADRLAMVRAAVEEDGDGVVVDDRELERGGPSYTADTLAELERALEPQRLYLILGADSFAAFERWYRPDEVLEYAHVIVTSRPGRTLQIPAGVRDRVVDTVAELAQARAGRVFVCPVTQLDISATAIRRRAAAGADLRYLMPEAVRRYLVAQELYQTDAKNPDEDRSAG
jgi:nicotinate-nucleotide adenylyltransferase